GHSAGASIALLAAAAAPERFTRVVLLAATPCYLNLPGYGGGFARADLDRLLGTFAGGDHAWATPLAHLLQGHKSPRTSMEELAGFFCEMDAVVAPQFARATFLADHRADVGRLPLPTLVLQCSHDVAVPDEVDDYWRAHLPRGTVVLLATCGHCPH
ncbi:alpha/beta hydrolase, partial [Enterobacter hormaechei]|uniref:alpha/beta hydrolase n=1 Tax=Enterobacter hormaechei TaxID=158836 RepID=UPI0013566E1C